MLTTAARTLMIECSAHACLNACEQSTAKHEITLPDGTKIHIDTAGLAWLKERSVPESTLHDSVCKSIVDALKEHGIRVPSRIVIKQMVTALLDQPLQVLPADDTFADDLIGMSRTFLKGNKKGVSLRDPGLPFRVSERLNITLVDSWVRGANRHVVKKPNDVRAVKDVQRQDLLCQGLRDDAAGGRLCFSTAASGLLAINIAGAGKQALPACVDGTAYHGQGHEFDDESGETTADDGKAAAKAIIRKSFSNDKGLLMFGAENASALEEVIAEDKPVVLPLTDPCIAKVVTEYSPTLRAAKGMEKLCKAFLVQSASGNTTVVFTCLQPSVMSNGANIHRLGNMAIEFFHEWMRAFSTMCGGAGELFEPFTTVYESPLYALLTKSGAAQITELVRQQITVVPHLFVCACVPHLALRLLPLSLAAARGGADPERRLRAFTELGRRHGQPRDGRGRGAGRALFEEAEAHDDAVDGACRDCVRGARARACGDAGPQDHGAPQGARRRSVRRPGVGAAGQGRRGRQGDQCDEERCGGRPCGRSREARRRAEA